MLKKNYIKTKKQIIASKKNARKMGISNKGRIQSSKEKNIRSKSAKRVGSGKWMSGRKLSKSHRTAIGIGLKGNKHSQKTKNKIGLRKKDKPLFAIRGKKHWHWKGGISSENEKIRKSLEYSLWRKSVLLRDNFTCRFCKKRGGKLHADHIKPFALFPELRFAIDNGRTLCKPCHLKTPTWGGNPTEKNKVL